MKHLYTIVTFIVTFMVSLGSQSAHAFSLQDNNIYYNIISPTQVVVTYGASYSNSYSGVIEVPATITDYYSGNSYNVVAVGDSAFYDCTSLTSITLPSSISSIGSYAFYQCNGLDSISIPADVTSIGKKAFAYSYNLRSISIPEGVTAIPISAFEGCAVLSSIDLPLSLTAIGDSAFYECMSLNSISVPESVTSIGSYAFNSCYMLFSIEFPEVSTISQGVLQNCSSLFEVSLPSTITEINPSSFQNCSSLRTIYCYNPTPISITPDVFDGVTTSTVELVVPTNSSAQYSSANVWNNFNVVEQDLSVAYDFKVNGIYYNTISTTQAAVTYSSTNYNSYSGSIAIPATVVNPNTGTSYSVTQIGSSAFRGSTSLNAVTIPSSVTSIGTFAFYQCSGLNSINIPSSVSSIGNYAFVSCTGLLSMSFPEGITSLSTSVLQSCSSLSSVILPSTLTSIGTYAFYNCGALQNIIIPSTVNSIGNSAFSNCLSITNFTFPEGITTVSSYVLQGCNSLKTLTLPSTITTMNLYPFQGCASLDTIYCYDYTPVAINTTTFYQVPVSNVSLIVPNTSTSAYSSANIWKNFNIVGSDPTTSIDTPYSANIHVYVADAGIHIEGIPSSQKIEIYNLSGQLVYQGTSQYVPLSQRGIYLVRTGTLTHKIVY